MNFKKALLPFAAGALALGLAACGGEDKADKEETPEVSQEDQKAAEEMQAKLLKQQVEKDLVVAIVNDEELLGEQYNAAVMAVQGEMQRMGSDPTSDEAAEGIKKQALDTLVNQTLILQQALAADLEVTEAEINEEYDSYIEQFGDEKTLKEALKAQDMKEEDFKEQIKELILFNKYKDKVSPTEEVSDEEVQEYYDSVSAESEGSEQEVPPLDEVRDEIKNKIQQNKQQEELTAHVQELKEDSDIELKI